MIANVATGLFALALTSAAALLVTMMVGILINGGDYVPGDWVGRWLAATVLTAMGGGALMALAWWRER